VNEVRVPGDKSIAHRFLILATLAEGESILSGMPASLDVNSTVACLRALGANLEDEGDGLFRIQGPVRWRSPTESLDCGNSGTTARLLTGLLVGLGVEAELRGDASLSRRPMDRVVYPLQAMGARIHYAERPDRLPLRVEGRTSGELRALRYRPRVSSAQVRGALLLAALASRTDLEILDRLRPRDHTERILRSMGVPVVSEPAEDGERIRFRASRWNSGLSPLVAAVPGDLSSAAFLIVAALLSSRNLTIRSIGLNPTRAGFLQVLSEVGAEVRVVETGLQAGEPVGDLSVSASTLHPFSVHEGLIPRLVDEVPVLAVLASRIEGVSVFRGAGELRAKESDRLSLVASNLKTLGVRCDELEDGLRVHGSLAPVSGMVRAGGDHRIAMAFGALGVAPGCEITVDDPECVNVSFPGYWEAMARLISGKGPV
jgi:3-phosphoshikimate 1-carboxyvinyltransferase